MDDLPGSLRTAAEAVAVLGCSASDFAALGTAELAAAQSAVTALRQQVDRYQLLVAGEIGHRSRPEFGHAGFAQREGFVSPAAMIQTMAGVSKQEATKLVRVGALVAEAEYAAALTPASTADGGDDPSDSDLAADEDLAAGPPVWQDELARALAAGELSVDGVDVIRRVFDDIDPDTVEAGALHMATRALVNEAVAGRYSPARLSRAARLLRDQIDEAGIAAREEHRRQLRSVRTWWDANGMHCGSWRLPPEDGTLVADAFDQVLSPRRGGPRFVDPDARATAEELLNDPRSTEQIAADALVEMVRLAVDADPGTFFGKRRPGVRVIVTADRLEARTGHGHIEGRPDAVSAATVHRHLCDTGVIAVGFDSDGQCMNVGRDQRLFTERQRTGMAVRDGGCIFTDCDRPPSYCEAHHIDPFGAAHGLTNTEDGVLLCRRHHLLIHANGWQIIRHGADYFLRPPPDIDPDQRLIPMRSQAPGMRDIRLTG